MQRFQFDHSPVWVLACLLIAAAYAWWLYRPVTAWGKTLNRVLAACRFLVVFSLALLLLGPIIRMVLNQEEKPQVVVLFDDSRSVLLADSVRAKQMLTQIPELKAGLENQGFEVSVHGLRGDAVNEKFQPIASDLTGALRRAETDMDGRNLAAVLLVSDGIFNSGISPVHGLPRVPVFTVGLGDTVQRKDIQVKSLSFNKVVYQGNTFPLRVDVAGYGLTSGLCRVQVTSRGKVVAREQREFTSGRNFFTLEFMLSADEPGLRRFDVSIDPVEGELNLLNNRAVAMVEVINGKKKILALAAAPHPDLSAIRAILERNEHYEFHVHIPGVLEASPGLLQPGDKGADLLIAHQVPDQGGRTNGILASYLKAAKPVLVVVGRQTDLRALTAIPASVVYERSGQWDEVFGIPVLPPRLYQLPEESGTVLNRLPPLFSPFGKFTAPNDAQVILQQRIGNVVTDRPLMFAVARNDQRLGFLLGEGWWRWRLQEKARYENADVTDEIMLRMIQYLSTTDDKKKFRFFPIEQEFSDSGPVTFEAQVFNDVYQPVYGLPVVVDVVSENGSTSRYSIVPGPGASRLGISLPEGVYRYTATLDRNGKKEQESGSFSVTPLLLEARDLTADFGLLRQVANASGGRFYSGLSGWPDGLTADLKTLSAPTRLSSEEVFQPLIDWPVLFFALLLLISAEWFLRKYNGGY